MAAPGEMKNLTPAGTRCEAACSMVTLLLALLTSSIGFAESMSPPLAWEAVPEAQTVLLTQDIVLGTASFPESMKFHFVEQMPLEIAPVTNFVFQADDCPTLDATSDEMALVLPAGSDSSTRDPSIGVLIGRGCTLDLYVENADLGAVSFFRPDSEK